MQYRNNASLNEIRKQGTAFHEEILIKNSVVISRSKRKKIVESGSWNAQFVEHCDYSFRFTPTPSNPALRYSARFETIFAIIFLCIGTRTRFDLNSIANIHFRETANSVMES